MIPLQFYSNIGTLCSGRNNGDAIVSEFRFALEGNLVLTAVCMRLSFLSKLSRVSRQSISVAMCTGLFSNINSVSVLYTNFRSGNLSGIRRELRNSSNLKCENTVSKNLYRRQARSTTENRSCDTMWWAYALCLPRDDWLFHRISTVRNKSALIEKIHYFLKIATQSFPPCRRQFIDVICVHRSMSCDPWKLIWYEAIRTKIEYAFSEEPVLLM